jgi:dihydroflavonol-4-reductase
MLNLKMQKIAITGASGHVGFVTHKMLLAANLPHKVLLRQPNPYLQNVEVVLGDLANIDALAELVKGCSTVIHIAGIVWPSKLRNKEVVEVNVAGTKRLFEAAKKAGVQHFVYISSIHALQETNVPVLDETGKLWEDERIVYNFSKAESERFLALQTGMKITILNPTAIIGGGDYYFNGMNQLFQKAEDKKLPMVVSGGYNVVDVKDVAKAIVYAVQHSIEGKFMIGGEYISMKALVKLYGDVNHIKVTNTALSPVAMKILAKLAFPVERILNRPLALNTYSVETLLHAHQHISSQKAKDNLHFSNRPLSLTLQDIHAWIKHKTITIE